MEEFGDNMGAMLALGDNVVIMGDLNIPFNKKDNPDTLAYCDLLHSFDLQQHVQCQTHDSGNTLDHIIAKQVINTRSANQRTLTKYQITAL